MKSFDDVVRTAELARKLSTRAGGVMSTPVANVDKVEYRADPLMIPGTRTGDAKGQGGDDKERGV